MQVNHNIRSSITFLLLLICGYTLAYLTPKNINPPGNPSIPPADEEPRIPPNCDDGGLKVTLSLTKDKVNPLDYVPEDITATVTLHNTNPYPITFHWVNTPLDHSAGNTGRFRLYSPPGWREIPLDYALIQRYCPDEASLNVTIPAGEMIEATHVLRYITKELRKLVDGKYVLRVEGHWFTRDSGEKFHMYCFMSPGMEVEVLHQPISIAQ